jgi:hypothetical protein
MKFVLVAATAVAFFAACGTKRNEERCLEGLCSDPDLPFCDVDGAIGGEPNACISVDCMPGEVVGCRDDRALTCNTAGKNYDLVDCPYGCDESGCKPCNSSECEKHIIPKYLPSICDAIFEGDPVVFSSQKLDTSSDLNCSGIVSQADGSEICVYRASQIVVPANQTLRVVGTRALALVADRKLEVVGTLDVSADSNSGIPVGPGPGATEQLGLAGDTSNRSGSGGAGFRTVGGAGGTNSENGGAGNGGAATTNPALLAYLVAGHSGPRTNNIRSGFGGGAVTLISCRATVSVTGLIDANGGGGASGYFVGSAHFPAGSGGSGGNVVIQGLNVAISGQLFANGGGGGTGESSLNINNGAGVSGQNGQRAMTTAAGGTGEGGGGSGGRGGGLRISGTEIVEELPTAGLAGSQYGGGGGGSMGFFQTYTPKGVNPALAPTAASPSLGPNQESPTNGSTRS